MASLLTTISLALIFAILIKAEDKLLPQCSCKETQECKEKILTNIYTCNDECKKHLGALEANFEQLRKCQIGKSHQFEDTLKCIEKAYPNACAKEKPQMLPKRYNSGFEIALISELNKLLHGNGLDKKLALVLGAGKKFSQCTWTCINKKTDSCGEWNKCSLDLPNDTELVATAKKCAIESGLLSDSGIQELCQCALDAGVKQLENICKSAHVA